MIKQKDVFEMVGKQMMDFTLPNSYEKDVSISSFKDKKNIVVVLLRNKA